jgi:hypothetical protein
MREVRLAALLSLTRKHSLLKMSRHTSILAVVVWLAFVAPAFGCPVCDSETGIAVRDGIARNFALNVLATLAPFPVLTAIVAFLHFGWPPRRKSG